MNQFVCERRGRRQQTNGNGNGIGAAAVAEEMFYIYTYVCVCVHLQGKGCFHRKTERVRDRFASWRFASGARRAARHRERQTETERIQHAQHSPLNKTHSRAQKRQWAFLGERGEERLWWLYVVGYVIYRYDRSIDFVCVYVRIHAWCVACGGCSPPQHPTTPTPKTKTKPKKQQPASNCVSVWCVSCQQPASSRSRSSQQEQADKEPRVCVVSCRACRSGWWAATTTTKPAGGRKERAREKEEEEEGKTERRKVTLTQMMKESKE